MTDPLTPPRRSSLAYVAPWLLAAAVWVLCVPPFLRLGLDCDATIYDLCARHLLDGGVPYRDLFETNLPGVIWLHAALRGVFGWRSEVLRSADVAVVTALTLLLTRTLTGASAAGRGGLAALLLLFYFSTWEWCHCQRDTWMLLPALFALGTAARFEGTAARIGEGALWGVAFWIKPYVALPSLACLLLSARRGRLARDAVAVLCGGLVVGAVGVAWLVGRGAWPAFAETVFVWNRDYVRHDVTGGQPWLFRLGIAARFFPWGLIHLAALPLAGVRVRDAVRTRERTPAALVAALYLGWTAQAFFLQHPFDYVHVPPILLGLAVVAESALNQRLAMALLVVCGALGAALTLPARASHWTECLAADSTPELRDCLRRYDKVDWVDLSRVRDYLREADIGDGELTCYNMTTVVLFDDLRLRPATRYAYLQTVLTVYASHRERVRQELADSRQRFVVCDLRGVHMARLAARVEAKEESRLVYRSGRYVVLRLAGAAMPGWLADTFDL